MRKKKARPTGSDRRGRAPRKSNPSKERPRKRGAQDRADDGPDQVICLLCGRPYRAIRVLHLRRIHGFLGEHPVEDYKRRFGLRVAACRDTCQLLADHRIERAKREGRHWTRAQVVAELRRKARAGEPLAQKRLGSMFEQVVRRRFGSWEEALRHARLDPDAHRCTLRWDGPRLTNAIRERHAAGKPLFAKRVKAEQPALYRAAIRRHGSWGAALCAGGFDPKEHRMPSKWSVQQAREWVHARRHDGRPFTAGHVPAGLYERVTKEVSGGWTAFVESLGIPYPGVRKRRDWTDAAVLAEIRALHRRGQPLNAAAVEEERGQALPKQARQRFGSWAEALRSAGIDPARVCLSRQWSRAGILAAIRARHAAGRPLDRPRVREQDRGLLQAAEARFDGGWPRALAAAGLGPSRRRRSRK